MRVAARDLSRPAHRYRKLGEVGSGTGGETKFAGGGIRRVGIGPDGKALARPYLDSRTVHFDRQPVPRFWRGAAVDIEGEQVELRRIFLRLRYCAGNVVRVVV